MNRKELVESLEKNAGALNYALPVLALQYAGGKAQSAFGEEQDLTTPEGRLENTREDLKWRGLGALAGIAAGVVLNRRRPRWWHRSR